MLRKKDRIFWWATGIFVLAIVMASVTKEQLWLALMIASYLLRPTLASLGLARHSVDFLGRAERHRLLLHLQQHRRYKWLCYIL